MSRRDEHIAALIGIIWREIGVNLVPQFETGLLLVVWGILDAAIEEEVQEARSTYVKLTKVSVN